MKKKLDQQKWLETQLIKDKIELENEKKKLISSLKGLKKEEFSPDQFLNKIPIFGNAQVLIKKSVSSNSKLGSKNKSLNVPVTPSPTPI